MASIMTSSPPKVLADQLAWNQAHDRLQNYLNTFALGDRYQVTRLTLMILDQCRILSRLDPTRHPTVLVMEQTQKLLVEWLEVNLPTEGAAPHQIVSSGCLTMLLSRAFLIAPDAFLIAPLPQKVRQAKSRIFVGNGPEVDFSSMTSRKVDYGPILDLANQTWHRWDTRSVLLALLFWAVVYGIAYFWILNF